MRASWVLISGCWAMYRCLEVSPGVRGWTHNDRPARPARGRFPPVCGGGPEEYRQAVVALGVSPGVRGWTGVGEMVLECRTGFPRCAGVDRDTRSGLSLTENFPPAHGGGPSL